jgi:hypothetical protein
MTPCIEFFLVYFSSLLFFSQVFFVFGQISVILPMCDIYRVFCFQARSGNVSIGLSCMEF